MSTTPNKQKKAKSVYVYIKPPTIQNHVPTSHKCYTKVQVTMILLLSVQNYNLFISLLTQLLWLGNEDTDFSGPPNKVLAKSFLPSKICHKWI